MVGLTARVRRFVTKLRPCNNQYSVKCLSWNSLELLLRMVELASMHNFTEVLIAEMDEPKKVGFESGFILLFLICY